MSFRSVVVTKRGVPEGLQIVQMDLLPPPAGEARVRILDVVASLHIKTQ
jgi:hypothetical protein